MRSVIPAVACPSTPATSLDERPRSANADASACRASCGVNLRTSDRPCAEGGSNREAIRRGLAAGARVIVAAALIMMSVFGSFILDDDPTVKQFGVGLSVGVALAAMTVLVFAPAVLVVAGKGSWWVPGWLDRILPHLDVEGAGAQARAPVATPRAQIGS
jgi:uncharacterized membrane protein YdfJ with MMPL/SSD domain